MSRKANRIEAIAYMRTSSASNVGEDRDSERRQRVAISCFAKANGYQIPDDGWYYDAAVKGTDAIEERPGFSALLDRIEDGTIRTLIIEDASRLARDLVVQELGIISLIKRGVRVVTASGEDLCETADPFKIAMRQIAGVFSQLEKARLVSKLRGARERVKARTGRCEGRKRYSDRDADMVALAARLRGTGARPAMSLRQIADALYVEGYGAMKAGVVIGPFAPSSVKRMLEQAGAVQRVRRSRPRTAVMAA